MKREDIDIKIRLHASFHHRWLEEVCYKKEVARLVLVGRSQPFSFVRREHVHFEGVSVPRVLGQTKVHKVLIAIQVLSA